MVFKNRVEEEDGEDKDIKDEDSVWAKISLNLRTINVFFQNLKDQSWNRLLL